jgi:hypothetical protein
MQLVSACNQNTATNMRVDLLSAGVDCLESSSSVSKAVFAEEQDGRLNIE